MNLEKDILDIPEWEKGKRKGYRWLLGFLLSPLVVPVFGGLVFNQIERWEVEFIIGFVLLILLIGVGLSGLFLARVLLFSNYQLPFSIIGLCYPW